MHRRLLITTALYLTAAGLLVPEWGRSMVTVPTMPIAIPPSNLRFVSPQYYIKSQRMGVYSAGKEKWYDN